MQVPFSPPDISQAEIDEVCDALRSGWITTGPKTKELEKEIAAFCNTQYACCLNSATAAMELCLHALAVGPGDEVITVAYTYTASASVVCHVGAELKLVDSQEDSYEMDYDKLADLISEKTKVIIPVDLAGRMVDYPKLFEVLESVKHRFKPTKGTLQECFDRPIVLADAAHSFGAEQAGDKSGSVADFTSFSFHAVKNFTTAEGGALVWKERAGLDSKSFYQTIMNLSLHGQTKDALSKTKLGSWEYDIVAPYYKCNMTDINAALGLAQMKSYDKKLKRRRELIEGYNQAFSDMQRFSYLDHYSDLKSQTGLLIPQSSSGHLYLLSLKRCSLEQRNELIIRMAQEGIACNVHYKPLPLLSAYKNLGFKIEDFPHAYQHYSHEISLPLHTCLSDEQHAYVCENLLNCEAEIKLV